jgi:DNA-binding CsgD family transcriptional regulator
MDSDLPPALSQALTACTETLWEALCDDAGCSITVVAPDGRIVWANERAVVDYEWHLSVRHAREKAPSAADATGLELDPLFKRLDDVLPPQFVQERLGFARQVADTGVAIVYESILRGVRQRVTIRRVETNTSQRFVIFIARRLRATERIEDHLPRNAKLVKPKVQDWGPLGTLSPRELDVLKLVGEGLTSPQIAARLHRSVRTVEGHRTSICAKLGLSSNVGLARIAIRAGLCEMPDAPDAPDALNDPPAEPPPRRPKKPNANTPTT